jgi:hypothetical protein
LFVLVIALHCVALLSSSLVPKISLCCEELAEHMLAVVYF